MAKISFLNSPVPIIPTSGTTYIFIGADKHLKQIDDTGLVIDLTTGGLSSGLPISTAAGTADAITATYSPAITLSNTQLCAFVATAANATTTPTFAPDGLTAHTIVKNGGNALAAGDIPGALAVCILEYNSANTRWELLNPAVGGAGGSDASTTVKGITKLSVAPVSPTAPIAVGDNDPRNSDARTPTAHAATHVNGTDDIQLATGAQKGILSSADWTTFNGKQAALGYTPENVANKDATGGYAGLTLFKINFKNVLNTFISFFTNSNTAARTYTFQDRNGTIADDTDLGLKKTIATGNNYKFETTGATGNLQETTVTPSRIVLTDANGLPVAADTTTYPSLTELAYVKGVTSAVQTQLNAKQNSLSGSKIPVYHQSGVAAASTNTTGEEVLRSVLIPAGTLGNNDSIEIRAVINSVGRAGTANNRVRIHTSAAAAGTVYLSSNNQAATIESWRTYGFIDLLNSATSQAQPGYVNTAFVGGQAANTLITSSLNTASDIYVVFTSQKGTGTDALSLIFSQIKITTP